jgi:hypothetical protein
MVVGCQVTRPHHPIKHIEGDQQHHRAMLFVLELTSCDLPRTHAVRRLQARERLNVWILIHTDEDFAMLRQPPNRS